jgi:hypothetical protein
VKNIKEKPLDEIASVIGQAKAKVVKDYFSQEKENG